MKLLADADALPRNILEILFRASRRLGLQLIVVASKELKLEKSDLITLHVVPIRADSADDRIVELLKSGDLVVTQDIPLADRAIQAGCSALDPRGTEYTKQNIKNRLSVRDLMKDLRSGGVITGGPAPFNPVNVKKFAAALDRILNRKI
jgi:uncharacterized protein YaiI (UPF0178 family)